MAQIDISISDAEYNQLVNVLTAWQSKLNAIQPALQTIMQHEVGAAKLKAWINNNPTEARLLVKTKQTYEYLKQYIEDIRLVD